MRRYLFILFIVAVTLAMSGCLTCCFPDPDLQRVLFADDYDYYANSSSPATPTGIVGAWSGNSSKTALVDPGLISDSWYGPVSGGEWFIFKDGGNFKYIKTIVESNGVGAYYWTGAYAVDGSRLTLYNINESWYPNSTMGRAEPGYKQKGIADQHYTYEIRDNSTMIIDTYNGNETFYRLFLR